MWSNLFDKITLQTIKMNKWTKTCRHEYTLGCPQFCQCENYLIMLVTIIGMRYEKQYDLLSIAIEVLSNQRVAKWSIKFYMEYNCKRYTLKFKFCDFNIVLYNALLLFQYCWKLIRMQKFGWNITFLLSAKKHRNIDRSSHQRCSM